MEDPNYSILNGQLGYEDQTLDPTLTTYPSYPTTTYSQLNTLNSMIDPLSFNNFPQPDVSSKSPLSNLLTFDPDELFNDLPRSSHDDLNQFFNDGVLDGGTPGADYLPGSKFGASGETTPLPASMTQNRLRNMQQSGSRNWEGHQSQSQSQSCASAVDTNLEIEQRETVIKNGQATPEDSPSSPKSTKGVRKTTRKSKATAKLEAASPVNNSTSTSEAPAAPAVVKKARKPRRSNKKKPTPEEEAAKRKTFLKRNREAAYKCRIKKKNQTEGIVEGVKMLDADNAVKGAEVEQLRREIEGLRALLLPHWRECGDQKISNYVHTLVRNGWGLEKMVFGSVVPRPKFEVEDEPREDDGRNNEAMSHSHPKDEDDDGNAETNGEPAHKRRRSEGVFEMSLDNFEESIAQQTAYHQRRESFFGNSLAPEEILRDALSSQRGSIGSASLSSSGAATPAMRASSMAARGMDIWSEEFLVRDTPPPLDLSAPDEDGN